MSAQKVRSLTVLFVFAFVIAFLERATSLPTTKECQPSDSEEDCLDAAMHPDLRGSTRSTARFLSGEDTNEYWLQKGKDYIRQKSRQVENTNVAKNIILFLGDGMGLTSLAAARNLLGGEEQQLSFETFPYTGLSKTYSVNTLVPDSACTATAFLSGVKNNYGVIGVNGQVKRGDCKTMRNTKNYVDSIAKWALDAGKNAGLVTNTRVTDASPAGVYAHTADRNWENDAELRANCGADFDLPDIAKQLIYGEVGKRLKVVLGGGKQQFVDESIYAQGKRADGKNLIADYLAQSDSNAYVETNEELFGLNFKGYQRLLGLFADSHMDYHVDAERNDKNKQPTLEEMTKRAIEFMQTEDKGYFLFIEGGQIDLAHHLNQPRVALDETVELSKAIAMAKQLTSDEDTLIVVTADHSHAFSIAGYQSRGSDIFGVASAIATDDKRYLSLSYANGPSFDAFYNTEKNKRRKPENVNSEQSQHDIFPATVPLISATHGGEDVAVFATGPWSHLFTGVYEQNAIPHMMAYAACVGNGLKAC